MQHIRLLICALIFGQVSPAVAQEPIDADKLASCMVEHSGETEMAAMKRLIIAALQDDVPGMKAGVTELGSAMLRLAMENCDVGLSQLEDKAFEAAAQKYGAILGERLMTDAFAKIQ